MKLQKIKSEPQNSRIKNRRISKGGFTRAAQALPQRQRLRGVCTACRSFFFKIDRIHSFDIRYSLFDIRYSLLLKFLLRSNWSSLRQRLT
jgi:hypothetical protein